MVFHVERAAMVEKIIYACAEVNIIISGRDTWDMARPSRTPPHQ